MFCVLGIDAQSGIAELYGCSILSLVRYFILFFHKIDLGNIPMSSGWEFLHHTPARTNCSQYFSYILVSLVWDEISFCHLDLDFPNNKLWWVFLMRILAILWSSSRKSLFISTIYFLMMVFLLLLIFVSTLDILDSNSLSDVLYALVISSVYSRDYDLVWMSLICFKLIFI